MMLAAVPLFYVGYNLAYGSDDGMIARQFLKFKEGKPETGSRETLHQTALNQAVSDRAMLMSYPRETAGPDLAYPE